MVKAQNGMCRFDGWEAEGLGQVTIEEAARQCLQDERALFFDIKHIGSDGRGTAYKFRAKDPTKYHLGNMPQLDQAHVHDTSHQTWRKECVAPPPPPPPPGRAFDRFLGNWTRKGYEPKYWIISMNGDNCEWRHSDDPTGAPGKVELIGEGQAKVTGIPWGAKWSTLTITGDGTLDEVNGNGEGPWHFVRL